MKLDNVSPQWVYNTDGEALSEMTNVQLLLWSRGLCISGHDNDGNTMIAKAYAFEKRMAEEVLNAVFMNEPLLAGPQPINKIWIAAQRSMMVPSALYQQELADNWLKQVYFIEQDEDIIHHNISSPEAIALFPLKQNLSTALAQFFPEGKIKMFLNKNIDCGSNELPFNAHVVILGNTAMLTLEEKGKLLSQQLFEYETIDNITYKIALAAQERGYSQTETAVFISGVLADVVAFSNEMKASYEHTQLCEETESLTFLTRLSQCE